MAVFEEAYVEADGFRIRYLESGRGSPVVILESFARGLSQVHHALADAHYHRRVYEALAEYDRTREQR